MSKLDLFRGFIRERLSTAALEIFAAFKKTFAEFQEEMYNSKEQSARLKRLLDIVTPPEIKIHQIEVQQLSLLEPPHIKEEQELWTSQEEEQLQGLKSETTDPRFNMESTFLNVRMSQLNEIRELFGEIITTAALKIYWAAEKPFAGYQEEISRSTEESAQLQRLLDVVTQPEIKLQRIDVQQLSLPEPPQIKEEEELWTSQEEDHLQGLQSETTDSIFTSLSVKHDSDQEGSSECSHLDQTVKVDKREGDSLPTNTTEEQIKAEPHVQDYAAPEPGSDSQPVSVVAPDCPAAQSLEEEHGGVMLLQNRTQNNEALSGDNRPQGSHTDKPNQCQQCKRLFPDKSALLKHMSTHSGEKPFQCQECSKTYTRKDGLFIHMRTHTGEKPFQCQECGKKFSYEGSLLRHMMIHTGEKPYKCQECSKTFYDQYNLKLHLRSHTEHKTHTGEKPYECQECGKTFSHEYNLLLHMKIHTSECPHRCQECKKNFSRKDHLVRHMRTHSGERPFICQVCDQGFLAIEHLVRHMRTHTGDKPYQCQKCKRCFAQKNVLDSHMRTHTGEKPYQCQMCQKCFAQRNNLDGHMRTHTGEKPYQCQKCKRCFAKKNVLDSHMRTHTGEKPFQCQKCKKCFSQKNSVDAHMRTHTDEGPYECKICKKCFTYKRSFLDHERIHAGRKEYQCQECKKCFNVETSLSTHMKKHHGQKSHQ
ncbi:zinc finger protein 345-like [Hypomesus transpacificus]|uniref:zinc finger protein 345-like n=1 Tax=Hypomesus transpacificus TaxID=137520 RepID=UPI001F07C98F|nr:zinc finger protein 345-like [Hypomesus transpacificus]